MLVDFARTCKFTSLAEQKNVYTQVLDSCKNEISIYPQLLVFKGGMFFKKILMLTRFSGRFRQADGVMQQLTFQQECKLFLAKSGTESVLDVCIMEISVAAHVKMSFSSVLLLD